MTDEKALELMTKEAFQTQAEAQGKLVRVKLSSTQLPTYYEGLREWLAFRKRYEAAAGRNFNLLKFHDLALDQGAAARPRRREAPDASISPVKHGGATIGNAPTQNLASKHC